MRVTSGCMDAEDWGQAAHIWMKPNEIDDRDCPLDELICTIDFVDMMRILP